MASEWGSFPAMRPRPPGPSGSVSVMALAVLVALSASVSCASAPLPPSGGRWVHPVHRYAIDAPRVSPDSWRAVLIDGADLAYLRSDGASLTLMSDCARALAPPWLLARQLLIGVAEREVLVSEPVEVEGAPGWRLIFRTDQEGQEITVHAVTLVSGGCSFDWVWVAPGRPSEPPWFEQWWSSFARAEDAW